MKYKVGDRIRIKSLDWYNKNKDNLSFHTYSIASCFANKIVTIKSYGRYPNTYYIDEYEGDFLWTDEMIEGLVEEEKKSNIIEEAKTYWDSIKDAWICPDGYIFKDENGNVINATKIVLEKKKTKYPQSLSECKKIIGFRETYGVFGYQALLLRTLQDLLICRDAYWKIAGEEMGLGRPWEPDWTSINFVSAIVYEGGYIQKIELRRRNAILSFPTKEMRDAFYENFKEEIEFVKELL